MDEAIAKLAESPKIGVSARMTKVRWHPFSENEVLCFSENQVLVFNYVAPASSVMFFLPTPEGITEIYPVPKTRNCTFRPKKV